MAAVVSITTARRGHALSDAELIDQLGEAKEHERLLGQRIDALKAEVKARGLQSGELGESFELTISASSSLQLDSKKIRAAMPASWCNAYSMPVARTAISAKRRPALAS